MMFRSSPVPALGARDEGRAGGDDPTPPITDTEIHARAATRGALLIEAVECLRGDLVCTIESAASMSWNSDDGGPLEGSLDSSAVERVDALLDLIRRIEAEVGRPADGQPAWLDAILDGERAL